MTVDRPDAEPGAHAAYRRRALANIIFQPAID